MKKDPLVLFRHISDAIGKIERFTKNGRAAFFENDETQDAVIRNLEVIGEAIKSIPVSVTTNYPEIAWSDAARMRDVLIHHYDGTDISEVWGAVEKHLPSLKKVVKTELKKAA